MLRAKPKVKRNYAKERRYDAKPIVKKKRVLRNAARNKLLKAGVVKKYDGRDVHHVGGNALNPNSRLKAVSASKNRSLPSYFLTTPAFSNLLRAALRRTRFFFTIGLASYLRSLA
jgi:hypothetical protein